jgi:Rrf2 family protein
MDNIQFATATHILTLLTVTEGFVPSAHLAGSININPAMVRKSLSILRSHGLVETKEGKGGGAILAKPADKILLSDVYRAVNTTPLLGKATRPNPDCPVGKEINNHLLELYAQADNALINKLSTITLADFCKKFQ